MTQKPQALQLADNRPWQQTEKLYEWALDAEEMLRQQNAEVEQLREQNTALDAACARLEKENQRLKFEGHLQRDVEEAVDQLRESAKAQGDSLVTTWHEKQAAEAALSKVKTQRDELLGALKWISNRCPAHMEDSLLHPIHQEMAHDAGACARAAIAKATGEQA